MQDEQIDATTHVIDLDDVTEHYTARELSESVVELIKSGKKDFVVDIRRATFLDAARSPLEALTSLEPRLRSAGASIALVADEHARKIFEITALDQRFQVYGSLDEALAAIRGRAQVRSSGKAGGRPARRTPKKRHGPRP